MACSCFVLSDLESTQVKPTISYWIWCANFTKFSDAIIRRSTNLLGHGKAALVVDTTNGTQAHQIHPWGRGWCARLVYRLLLYRQNRILRSLTRTYLNVLSKCKCMHGAIYTERSGSNPLSGVNLYLSVCCFLECLDLRQMQAMMDTHVPTADRMKK